MEETKDVKLSSDPVADFYRSQNETLADP